ncbi:hypothetical protein JG688_00002935 [Phytophthora aleatoria]|uniref:TOG domain-containing protein n=1 Tax=Phytophthora aleatoria TaxID=2496075 RepID=A0A8J5J3K8_9STRA|nr:hypothetical protein JG688_00002935 [Phytophthora aleatoria]
MEKTAALLASAATKQRFAGITRLLEQLRRQEAVPESSATLFPHVLPCLRDHNSKIALGALEIFELLVARVTESTLRSYFNLLWISLVERLGDSKLLVREKAVDVVVEISVVLDVTTVLEKLKDCMSHKNWRTREQSLHAVWRCLERHDLFKERQEELLNDVLKLLEDSSKDVRDAAITTLEKFYTFIGPSLLSDLEYKNIRAAHMKTLTSRFEGLSARSNSLAGVVHAAPSRDAESPYSDAPASNNALPDELSSILSSYDLQVSSSSSSMARYLASVRSRTLNEEAKATAASAEGSNDISEKDIQRQLGVIFDKLEIDNNWDKRVDGLKMLQKLIECVKSRNQVLRYNAVCYLTLTLQQWSVSFLSKMHWVMCARSPGNAIGLIIISSRLEAAEYIGKYLQRRVNQIESGASEDHKLDDRILIAFIKHLSDAHYRVSQGVLKHLLPLLKLSNDSQRLLPHLKTALPKLFQKFIDTKESIRVVAKENLEYIASTVDSSTLAAIVISMLGDGSNMKVKAAMCHYLRELLPGAEGYMKHGTNNSHMRSFLLKIALLMDTDVPVSVSSACGELVSVASQLYGPEMEVALGLLPPSKRLVVSKILKSKKIVLNFSNPQRPPFSTSSTTPHSARSRDGYNDNQEIPPAPKPERSRKRVESPSVDSSSPARQNSQKRINTTSQITSPVPVEDQRIDARPRSSAAVERLVAKTMPSENVSFSSAMFSFVGDRVDKHDVQLEDILHILEQNNLPEAELKHALRKTLHFIKNGSSETWDRCFGRLLLLLLDAATENNVYALNLLQRLVEAQPSRAQMFFELLLQRLIDSMVDQVDVAHHLMERILHDLVSSASDHQQTLSVLIPLGSNREPPMLQVVLRLIKVCFQTCERSSPQESAFLCQHDVADRLMSMLARRVDHASASVRKHAVDCLVAFHFATKEDSSIMPKYLTELDDTRRRLVEIFINRAKMERHHIGLSST